MHSLTQEPQSIDLKSIFNVLPGNSLLVLPDAPTFTIVAVTDEYLQVCGRSRDALVGKGLFEAFPSDPASVDKDSETGARASLEHALLHKEPHQLQFHRYDILGSKGVFEERYWQIHNRPIVEGTGEVVYLIHTVEDVTDLVRADKQEEAIKKIEKANKEFLSAPILMCIIKGKDYIIEMANDRTLQAWGQTAEVIGKPLLQVVPELEGQGIIEDIDKVKTTGNPLAVYERPAVLFQNGVKKTLYFNLVFHPYFENEAEPVVTSVICVAHDVTEQVMARKEAEESEHRFKELVAEADIATAVYMGREMRIQYANEAMIRLWGKDRSVIGKTVKEALPELEGQPFHQLLDQVFTTGITYWGKEDRGELVVDGKRQAFYFNFSYKALRNANGEIYGILNMATDVTEQVMAKQRLAESERNLRNTILQAPVAMCILKGDSYVVEVANERMFELWGKQGHEVLQKPIFESIPEARHQGLEELLLHVYTTGETYAANERPVALPRKGGMQTIYVNFVYEPFREGDGTISGIIAVAFDVTEQVMSRKIVEESEQRVRSIVESAPFPIGVYVGREMRIELANQSIIDVWGKGPDVIGKRYSDVLPELGNSEIFAQLDQVFTTGVPFHARNQQVDIVVEGELQPFYFNYSFTPLYDTTGKIYGVMNTAAEITDQVKARKQIEQSEQNFRSMILQAPVAMCIMLGPNHVVDIANDVMIELWGKPRESVMHKPVFEGLPDARQQGLEQLLDNVYQTGVPFHGLEHPVSLVRNGKPEVVYQNFVYEPYKDSNGHIIGVLAISVDVTPQVLARHKIEDVVKERTKELEQRNKELEQFTYISHHDLQEPLRKIIIFADMIRAESYQQLSPGSQKRFDKIAESAKRMSSALRDVLNYASLNKEEQLQPVDLNEVIAAVNGDLELAIEDKKATISVDVLPVIKAVPPQMHQLFYNLLNNALKFAKANEPAKIKIASQSLEPDDLKEHPGLDQARQYYQITIKDNGIGFNQNAATKIFDMFQRLHDNHEYAGTGIGLALCKKVVMNHAGKIWAESKPGLGATFKIILPAK